MKKLKWRCRISPFSDWWVPRFPRALAIPLLAVVLGDGCQLSHRTQLGGEGHSDGEESSILGIASPLAVQPPLADGEPEDDHRATLRLLTPERVVLGSMVAPAVCPSALTTTVDTAMAEGDLRLRLSLVSDAGTEAIRYYLRTHAKGEAIRARVGNYWMSFATTSPTKERLVQLACGTIATGNTDMVVDAAIFERLREWLDLTAPDCRQLRPTPAGWRCELPGIVPAVARQELAGIQITMIRRWNRQPYLLARRLAIGISLADALASPQVEHRLDVVCNIIRNSLPVELPATLASHRWQGLVCNGPSPHRQTAAAFGLAKTVAEIDFMRQLFERTSRLGSLTLRLPTRERPTRDVLVSLVPESDVADSLTKETVRLSLADDAPSAAEELPRACWHPIYAEDDGLLDLARHMGLSGDAAHVACAVVQRRSPPEAFAPERYFAESITSETEFVLTNGHSKTLRLPRGKYTYTLRPLPDDPDEWDDVSQTQTTASGEIAWDSKRPHAVINSW